MSQDKPWLHKLLDAGELAETGACWNCGFLCHKDEHNRHISSYAELTTHNREWGRFFTFMQVWVPWCFKYEPILPEIAERLGREPTIVIHDARTQDEQNEAAMAVVIKDRQCVKWMKYMPGLGPKEHWDKEFMRELEELRRANDLKIAELDQRSQESTRAIMEAHKAISEATQRDYQRSDRINTRFQIAFIILASIALALAFLPLAYPNGIEWLSGNMPGAVQNESSLPAPEFSPERQPSPAAVELTPIPSPESIPGRASPQPQSTP